MNQKILIISPTLTHPTTEGNRVRIFKLLEEMDRIGVSWHFVFVRTQQGDEEAMLAHWGHHRCECLDADYRPRRRSLARRIIDKVRKHLGRPRLACPYKIDDWCGDRLTREIDQIRQRINPKVIWIEYVFLSRLFNLFDSDTIKVLDTHDVFANRHKMMLRQGIEPQWYFTTPSEERKGCRRADVVVAIQQREEEYFSRSYDVNTRTIGHFVEVLPCSAPTTNFPVITFIGSGNSINLDALKWFYREIWPKILVMVSDARFEVYGDSAKVPAGDDLPNVHLLGRVDCLDEAYKRSWLVVAPLRAGTGLKIKSMEALGRGKALVATACGAEGLEDGAGTAYLPADTAAEFAAACVKILRQPELRSNLETSAVDYARAWNQKNQDNLRQILRTKS